MKQYKFNKEKILTKRNFFVKIIWIVLRGKDDGFLSGKPGVSALALRRS